MKLLFYLHHPAQFHLFKHVIVELKKRHEVLILATKKDILENLLKDAKLDYINVLPNGRKDNKFAIALGLLKQDLKLFKICRNFKPDLLIGTSTEITHIGKLLSIPSLFFIEDDIEVIPLVGMLAHPFAKHIITPSKCNTGKWAYKTIKYEGYQKLAYLHPRWFKADRAVVDQYFPSGDPFFIIRLAKLKAHHDSGINGINHEVLKKIITLLEAKGRVIISSEAELPDELKKYTLKIRPEEMHHFMFFSDLFIGDSQSMSVESAILGTPNIRISSFSGRISVLEELEHTYQLTFGVKPENEALIFEKLNEYLEDPHLKEKFHERKERMLADKIDVSAFLVWFIENYPSSETTMRKDPLFQRRFV